MFTREQFSTDVLAALGNGGPHPDVLAFMNGWSASETLANSGATFNLYNTELDWNGATLFNDAGVKNYPSYEVGIQATVLTLKNGFYTALVNALSTNDPSQLLDVPASSILADLHTWCGCNYGAGFAVLGEVHGNDQFDYGSEPAKPSPPPSGPNDHQISEANDCWNSFFKAINQAAPVTGTGIYEAWLSDWVNLVRVYGPPITHEYDSNDWNGAHIVVQEFAHARCEWNGFANWYGIDGRI